MGNWAWLEDEVGETGLDRAGAVQAMAKSLFYTQSINAYCQLTKVIVITFFYSPVVPRHR